MVEEANGVKIGDDRYDDHVKELLKQHGLRYQAARHKLEVFYGKLRRL